MELHRESTKFAWWIEIHTKNSLGTYYFGPFKNWAEAMFSRDSHLEDLTPEEAKTIRALVKYCCPGKFTVSPEKASTVSINGAYLTFGVLCHILDNPSKFLFYKGDFEALNISFHSSDSGAKPEGSRDLSQCLDAP